MLDFLVEDISSLKTKLNSSDKVILDRHLTSVREVESSINVDITDVDSCHIPDVPNTITFQKNAEHFTDMIPLVYACDTTRVFSFSIDDEGETKGNNGKETYEFLPEVNVGGGLMWWWAICNSPNLKCPRSLF